MQTQVVSHSSPWEKLHTVTTFDAGQTYPVETMSNKNMTVNEMKCFSPSSLLVESLIEHLCRLLEKDPTNQQNLYKAICGKLHQMKLIDHTYRLEEFESLRSHYQKALLHLVSVAKSTVATGESNSIVKLMGSHLGVSSSSLKDEELLNWSRYGTDYVELEFIAKGGFGQVFKVRHKLDGGEYAIKKIFLRYRNLDNFYRSIQEVKLLAKLNHPNIVSYKAAWLEPLYSVSSCQNDSSKDNLDDGSSTSSNMCVKRPIIKPIDTPDESCSIIFRDPDSENNRSSFERGKKMEEITHSINIHRKSISEINHYIAYSSIAMNQSIYSKRERLQSYSGDEDRQENLSIVREEKALCPFIMNEGERTDSTNFQHEWAVLYIQMQLCTSTLRDWLDQRNSNMVNRGIDLRECLQIFHDIVCGVQYIHSQGIVHHDIKPSNIFVSGIGPKLIQVGDFGLACFLQHSHDGITLITSHNHKGEIGTKLYAAPEQLSGKCNMKSDIFSLGIILFELLCPFNTDMERSLVISKARAGYIPPNAAFENPKLMQLLKSMLLVQPQGRPSSNDVLKGLQFILKSISNDNLSLQNQLNMDSKKESIEQLRQELLRKEQEVEELRRKVLALESNLQN